MAKDKPSKPDAPQDSAAVGPEITAEIAAALVGIEPDQVFAFHDHGAFVRVVTVDGRKLDGKLGVGSAPQAGEL